MQRSIKDNNYLEDEVRDGFYIPSIAKRAWAAELSILREINRICDKYNIRYYADWGSMLGAVRHQGFIPWDDDLDICMFRRDLNKFMEVADKELPDSFRVQSFLNSDYSWKFIINVVNTERMCFTPEYLKDHYNFPYIATIDIFVIDNVYDDEEKEKARREKVKFILSVADAISEENIHTKDVKELLEEVEKRSGQKIDYSNSFIEIKRRLYVITQDMIVDGDDDSEYIVQQIPWGVYHKRKDKRELFEGIVRIPFEDTYIQVPKLYDRILRKKYGNYWEIRMGAAGHGYPYYNAQKAALGLAEDEDYIPHYRYKGLGDHSRRDETIAAIEEYKKSEEYEGQFDRETVVFLPYKGEYWGSMKALYEEECAKENVDVYVVPLPYYYKDYDGTFMGEAQYDLDAYPEELPIYLLEQLDLEAMFPDRIYIQNPYDEYNMCTSIPTEYYVSRLMNLARKIIYIPWFEISDFSADNYASNYNMQYYCLTPGVVLSDEVILQSEVIKERYIDKLCEFAGDETRNIWENKIQVRVRDTKEKAISTKTLVFYVSPGVLLEYKDQYIVKIKNSIELFDKNSDSLSVVWHFDKGDMAIIESNDARLAEIIACLKQDAEHRKNISIDEVLTGEELASKFAAYYGDASHIAKDFWAKKKPVMIGNPEINN